MKLSVIIVNYNVKYYLEQCLCSLYRAIDETQTEIFVVDNASSDGSYEYITNRFPHIKYIRNKENKGFSRANNQAISQAKGEYILLLNPDTVVPEKTISNALSFMDNCSQAGAAGVKMITSDGSFLPESKRRIPTPMASFWKLTGMQRLFPSSPRFNGYYMNPSDNDSIQEVEVLAGAFMMIRHSVLMETGFLDEDFFMFGEDIDLSCRILQAGYKNYYLPYPILHYKGESTQKNSSRYVQVFYGAMDIFFRKHGKSYNPVFRVVIRAGIGLKKVSALCVILLKKLFRVSAPTNAFPVSVILGKDENLENIRNICNRNGLNNSKCFIVENENLFNADELNYIIVEKNSLIIYDVSVFSTSNILTLLSGKLMAKNIHLGLYNPETRVLITPQSCYQ